MGEDLPMGDTAGQVTTINLLGLSPAPAGTAAPAATPAPAAGPAAAATKPAGTPAAGSGLQITGTVGTPPSLSIETLRALGLAEITAEHPKQGKQTYKVIRLNALLGQAQPEPGATKVVLGAADGYSVELPLADLGKCADCGVAVTDDGKLSSVMPGQQSSFWVKDLVQIEVR